MDEQERRVEDVDGVRSHQPGHIRTVPGGAFLFREGDVKTSIYRVESGAICTYQAPRMRAEPFIEFIYSGGWLGFGYLDRHICRARALGAARGSCFPLSSVNDLVERHPRAKARLADMVEREFAFQRNTIVRRTPLNSDAQVAAFLLSLAAVNSMEGRNHTIIVETMPCGLIAETLSMSIDTLAAVLLKLERRGVIEPRAPHGLRLKDVSALEAIASSTPHSFVDRSAWTQSITLNCHGVSG
jgi:CRP/FNR family transcriptional regulator